MPKKTPNETTNLNEIRAGLARDVINFYIEQNSGVYSRQETLTDVITDLMHWTHREFPGEPELFYQVITTARCHFKEELSGEE